MGPDTPIRLLLVDDHTSFRVPLAFMLEREPDLVVVGQAGSVAEARTQLTGVDVALVDLYLPDGDGREVIHGLHRVNRRAEAIVLTGDRSDRARALAVAAGASGVLIKTVDTSTIIAAVRQVYAGEPLIPPAEAFALLEQAEQEQAQEEALTRGLSKLTQREREVLQALADGLGDKEIAARLFISERTVRVHMVNLLAKLGVESRLQAVIVAIRGGVVRIK